MIVYREWTYRAKAKHGLVKVMGFDGWFLLWFVPLYVRVKRVSWQPV